MAGTDKVLHVLKTHGEQTAQTLATLLQLTSMGARKHLEALQQRGLVWCEDRPAGKGRPARYWRLTEAGHARFPDRHGELTAQLLMLLRETAGEDALTALIAAREQQSMATYRAGMAAAANLELRLQQLAAMRSEEGYMAELQQDGDAWLLIEHHCPICAAARVCQGFCRSELAQFSALLPDAVVSREAHLLAGGARCVYRICPAKERDAAAAK